MTAIWKVILTHSSCATYRTSEMGFSMLALMPRSEDEWIDIKNEYQQRRAAGKNVTTTDLQKSERQPRMPPTRWEDVIVLFTTYTLLVEMLFTQNYAHLQGINSVQRQLMMMANIKHCFDASYYATIVWACMYNGVQHFDMHMPYPDLQGPDGTLSCSPQRRDCMKFPAQCSNIPGCTS